MLQAWNPSWTQRRIDAAAIADGTGYTLAPVDGVSVVLTRSDRAELVVEAIGPTTQIADSSRWQGVEVLDRRGSLLIPGLVNAHTHLDLTHIGPRPHDPGQGGGFADWIGMIRKERRSDSVGIQESVTKGVALSLKGGTVLLGDIAGAVGGKASPEAGEALGHEDSINAVTFMEFFASGPQRDKAAFHAGMQAEMLAKQLADRKGAYFGRIVGGLQPHAPYSVELPLYRQSFNLDMPICTHLAESMAERRFVTGAEGPLVDMLTAYNLWQGPPEGIGQGKTPVELLTEALSGRLLTAVHVNDASDLDIRRLAAVGWPVVYCPRASAYFAAERDFGPHRYRDMLAAGIPVALGTDSIVNLDRSDRMSVWDEMCLLHRRDGTDPVVLLQMATIHGATALRREPEAFTFRAGGVLAGLVAVQGKDLGTALKAGADPELLAIGRV